METDIGPRAEELGLLTDLYEFNMAAAYLHGDMNGEAVFSLFFRNLPAHRNVMLACGQEHAARLVTELHFPREQIERLRQTGLFPEILLEWLAEFRFSGDIHAMPEGTPVFPHEPLLEIRAPIAEAQLLESLVMNYVNLETVLASKAVRVVQAAAGRPVMDFGMRRMRGLDAALRGVRAYRAAGISATSNVLASLCHGLPARGTMAHSYVQAHDSEVDALRNYARLYPGTTLLVDTHDTLRGVERIIQLVRDEKLDVGAIRIDSGDLLALSRQCRDRLDRAGLENIGIVVSGGLDEWDIRALLDSGAPIDAFGVGTDMGAAADAPALDLAYKLTEYNGKPRLKNSPGKQLHPGAKQVWRFSDGQGHYQYDEITARDEGRDGCPLLRPVVKGGTPLHAPPEPDHARQQVRESLDALPPELSGLEPTAEPWPVRFSDQLKAMREKELERLAE